jgi:hypothetical protein
MPYSIDQQLVEIIERHASVGSTHDALLVRVSKSAPDATLRDIARAAFYAATNPAPANEAMTARLYDFAITVRRLV